MKPCLLRAPWFICLLAAAGLLSLAPGSEAQQDVKSIQVGKSLELLPNTPASITGVLWKYGPNKVAEWDKAFGPEVDYYGTYKGRTELNKETGKLIISNMDIADSGEYSVEVNGQLQSRTYKLEVISPKPTPWGWIIGGIVVGVLAVGLGLLAVKMRGRKQ